MQATICDVEPRDGLQNEQAVLAPSVRAELVDRLAAAALPAVEAVSFAHPGKVPQMQRRRTSSGTSRSSGSSHRPRRRPRRVGVHLQETRNTGFGSAYALEASASVGRG